MNPSVLGLFPVHRDTVIAATFLIDEIEGEETTIRRKRYHVRGYTANSIEECIIAAVEAEKDGAPGIVRAPIHASMIEKIIDVPVAIMNRKVATVMVAMDGIARQI